MLQSSIMRFYLPSTKSFLYPESVFCIKDENGESHYFINDNEPVSSIDSNFVPQDFTGHYAVNGDLFVGDVVDYNNKIYQVVYVENTDGTREYFLLNPSENVFVDIPSREELEIISDIFSTDDVSSFENYEKTNEEEPASNQNKTSFNPEEADSIFQDNFTSASQQESITNSPEEEAVTDEDFIFEDEDFSWDYDPADLLDTAYVKTFRNKENIFIKTTLDRINNRSAYGVYLKRDEDLVINGSYDECNKKTIELIALEIALAEIQEPSLIRLHLDNGFLKNLINNPDSLNLDEKTEYLFQELKPSLEKHSFCFSLENKINPTVESVIAKEAAMEVL